MGLGAEIRAYVATLLMRAAMTISPQAVIELCVLVAKLDKRER